MNLCDAENRHLVVRDLFAVGGTFTTRNRISLITDRPRTVSGDCYCTRCCHAVAFWFNGCGEPYAATATVSA